MRICFIWAETFKNLQNFGINLSNDFSYVYDDLSNAISRTKKAPLPDGLFGQGVSDITGLLGINGSGKSNTLELICLALKYTSSLTTRYLIVYEVAGLTFYFNSDNKDLALDFDAVKKTDIGDFSKFNVIYFSNVFDKNFLELGSEVRDISTNNKNNPRSIALSRGKDEFGITNEIDFISATEFANIDLRPPTTIEIKIARALRTQEPRNQKDDTANKFFALAIKKYKALDRSSDIALTAGTIKLSFLTNLIAYHSERLGLSFVDEWLSEEAHDDNDINDLILSMHHFFFKNDCPAPWNLSFNMSDLLWSLSRLDHLLETMNFSADHSIKNSKLVFHLTYDFHNPKPYRQVAGILELVKYSSIDWSGMSSGEKAYLNLFSSIWNALEKRPRPTVKTIANLICIDEGDLYLHPEWQIAFIERLIKSLPTLSNGNTQLVITTHSPILVSDLPHQCVIKLNSANDQHVTTADRFRRIKTFGANLYDIYSNSFGLQQRRTGNISAAYIRQTLKTLDKSPISPAEKRELEIALSIIDDSLIHAYLKKRIAEL